MYPGFDQSSSVSRSSSSSSDRTSLSGSSDSGSGGAPALPPNYRTPDAPDAVPNFLTPALVPSYREPVPVPVPDYHGTMNTPYPTVSYPTAGEGSSSVGCMTKYNFQYKGFLPVLAAFLTFLLSMLAFLAEQKPGDLNDVNLMTINTSTIPSTKGVEFYSVHVMSICMGEYKPDAKAPLAVAVPFQCQSGLAALKWDILDLIEHGGETDNLDYGFNRSAHHVPATRREISYTAIEAIHDFSKAQAKVCYLLMLGVIGSGLGLGFSFAAVLKPVDKYAAKQGCGEKSWAYVNFVVTLLKFFCLLTAAAIGTSYARYTVDQINGRDDEIHAIMGHKWYGIMGGAVTVAALELGWWVDMVMIVHDVAWCISPGRQKLAVYKRDNPKEKEYHISINGGGQSRPLHAGMNVSQGPGAIRHGLQPYP
ncbi:hypothetical protein QBC44DRAFT_369551 [Cladorrhinum sp. PSN332]|nr:hypothetical protein QBC44DRAFT_369551 [Cladorrhinum sp. PSN332]